MKKRKKVKYIENLGIRMEVYHKPLVDEKWLMKSDKMKFYDKVVNSPGVMDFLRERGLLIQDKKEKKRSQGHEKGKNN